MKEERVKELLNLFEMEGISHEPKHGLDRVLEFQDLIGRSALKDVRVFYKGLDQPGRRTFLWVCFNVLSMSGAIDILKECVIRGLVQEKFNEAEERVSAAELNAWEATVKAEKAVAATEKERANLKAEVEALKRKLDYSDRLCASLEEKNAKLQGDADDLLTLKRILIGE